MSSERVPVSSTVASISSSDVDCDRECELRLGDEECGWNSNVPGGIGNNGDSSTKINGPAFWNRDECGISGDDSNDDKQASSGDD